MIDSLQNWFQSQTEQNHNILSILKMQYQELCICTFNTIKTYTYQKEMPFLGIKISHSFDKTWRGFLKLARLSKKNEIENVEIDKCINDAMNIS